MKKLSILFFAFLVFNFDVNAWIKVNYSRDKWRLFGYDYVQENFAKSGTNCSFSLTCNGSGFTSCKFTTYDISTPNLYGCQSVIVNNSNNDWVDVLHDDIDDRISAGNTGGTFVRADIKITHPTTNVMEDAVVVWSYAQATNLIEMKVYSYNEAVELGLI